MASRRRLLLRVSGPRTTIAAALACHLTCIWLLAGSAHALDPNKRITQYIHTSWRVEQDNIKPHGYGIAQTSDGFLWFTSGDMTTFDGLRFTSWDGPPNGGSITKGAPFGQIVQVVSDHGGGLWVFGLRGIVHLKGRVVTSQFELQGLRNLQNFSEDDDGSIWVVRGNNSISDLPLCHVADRTVKCFGKADGIPISPVNSILADGKGGFWLGGQTALVHWHDGVSETYPIEGLKSNAGQAGIAGLARGPDGSLWVGILREGPGRGLGQLTKGAFQPFVTPSFDGSKLAVHNMIFDRDGSLWVGTVGQGIFRICGNVVDHYGRTEGLSSDNVTALFEDREGILWAATPDGIDNSRDPRIASFSTLEGLGNRPMGVLAGRDGTIWVASTGSLDRIEKNGTISSIRTGDGLPGSLVASMLEDRAGNMWVGVDDGLFLFKNGRFRRLPEPNHKPLGSVVGMAEDIDGNIWAECAGNPGKLVRIRDFQVREEFPASQVPTGRTLAPDPQGGIWIGTLEGDLALFRHGVLKTFPLNAKGDPFIRQIIANADGSVLAGSADGLVGVRQGKVQRMTTKNGLPCNFVTSFIQDREKRWWLYTDCGIVELPDSELQRWWTNPEVIVQTRVYGESDGAQAGRPDYNSAAYSSDGRVWFASGVWVQMVDPSRLSQKAFPAATYIESVVADRKEFTATDNLRLPPNPRDLQIDYTSPTFTIPQKVKFRYRLDGYDRDWKDAGTRRQAFYTDLPPGRYSFRVIACNSDGVWNDSAAKLDFYVAPAYYQTNWFRALCATVFLALLWAAYQWRVRQLHHQFDITLEARVGERTRIARDLHDTLLQSFHGLVFRFQAARNMLPNRPEEATQALDTALIRAEQALDESRHSIQGLRPSQSVENELDQMLITTGQELASSNHAEDGSPRFEVIVDGERRGQPPMIKDEIGRIARELLRNAFRHARAHEIEVEIRYENDVFRLIVRDDGKGMD
ncbi:MAG: two-component regulator propeller domain-containing protein, partial [Terriglobales bacterium]